MMQDAEQTEQDCSMGERFHWRRAAHVLRIEVDRGEVSWDEERKVFVCRRLTGTACLLCTAIIRVS